MNNTNTDILLESGTNELELMEFTIAGQHFGINVAKVQEILQCSEVKPMQSSHPNIEGVFKPRDDVITVIDLPGYMGLPQSDNPERDIFIVTHFNGLVFAFHVHSVVGIDRIFWTKIRKPDRIIYGGGEGVATGIADYEDRLITILDFEKIIAEISPDAAISLEDLDLLGPRERSEKKILIAEDSMLLSKMILESLRRMGYKNTIKTDNGAEAWEYLCTVRDSGDPLEHYVHCVISDIEMPQMDGHRLTKLIKSDPVLQQLPVILFSSLISEQMRLKGEDLGVDAQVSKPEIADLVTILDQLMSQ